MNPYFITGTGTDIGKTWLTCALLQHWRAKGMATRAFKPVLSGYNDADAAISDAGALLLAQGIRVDANAIDTIAPWRFAAPLSPDMAAALDGRAIDFDALIAFTRRVTSTNWQSIGPSPFKGEDGRGMGSFETRPTNPIPTPTLPLKGREMISACGGVLIEGVGGVMVPLDDTHTVRDWIAANDLPCVLVVGSYLGSLSHTLTALAALIQVGIEVAAIVVNETVLSTVPLTSTIGSLMRHARGTTLIAIERHNPSPGIAELAAHLESRPVYTARQPD